MNGQDGNPVKRPRCPSFRMLCMQEQQKNAVIKRKQSSGTVKVGCPPAKTESTGRGRGQPPKKRKVSLSRSWMDNLPTPSTSMDELKEDSAVLKPSDKTAEKSTEVTAENETIADSSMKNMVTSKPADERSNLVDIPESSMTEPPSAVNAGANEEKIVFDTWSQTEHAEQISRLVADNPRQIGDFESELKRIQAIADRLVQNANELLQQGNALRREVNIMRKISK